MRGMLFVEHFSMTSVTRKELSINVYAVKTCKNNTKKCLNVEMQQYEFHKTRNDPESKLAMNLKSI